MNTRRTSRGKSASAFLSLMLLAAGPLAAEPPEDVLTVAGAVRLALASSHEAAIAAADVGLAQADVDIASGRRGPRVDLTADYTRTTNPVMVFGNLLRQGRFTADDFDLDALNGPDPLGNWNATVSLSQPLYAGGSLGARTDAARAEVHARTAEAGRAGQHVRFATISAYADAVMARHQLEVAGEIVATAAAHERLVADLAEAGLAVNADLLQARLRREEAFEVEIRAAGLVDIAQAGLNLLLGRATDSPLSLPDAARLAEELRVDTPLASLTSAALTERPDLLAARFRVEASEDAERAAHGARLPELGLWGAVETNAHDFFGADGTNWTLMMQARWSVFDGSARSSEETKARLRRLQAERAARLLERDIRLAVHRAHTELQTARERVGLVQTSLDLAQASLLTVEDRYREGMVTLVDLLEAQTSLTRARARGVVAQRDLLIASAALDLAVGQAQALMRTNDETTPTEPQR